MLVILHVSRAYKTVHLFACQLDECKAALAVMTTNLCILVVLLQCEMSSVYSSVVRE